VFTVSAALGLICVWVSTASRRRFAARQADAFVGYWLKVPIRFERLAPFSHQKKCHVLILLSKAMLPLLCRCIIENPFEGKRENA
jgi:hypothetical protein